MLFFPVSDFAHDLHAALFKIVTGALVRNEDQSFYEEGSEDIQLFREHVFNSWLKVNMFLGYSVALVPIYAIIWMVVGELFRGNRQLSDQLTKSSFVSKFWQKLCYLWIAACLTSIPVLLNSDNVDHFG